jgi:hypothetical protein
MAVTAVLDEQYGAAPGTNQANVANLNLGSTSIYELVPASYPIAAGGNSYEKWFKIHFTGISNKVDNIQIWKSAGTIDAQADLKTNCRTSSYGGAETYTTPIDTTSTKATQQIAEADPTAANLGIAGILAGSLVADGSSDYCILQYQATASHPAGNIAQLTLTFQWDEQ